MPTDTAPDDTCLLYTPDEAARLIHPDLKPRTMERWRRKGTGPKFVQIGRRIGYTREAIHAFIQHNTRRHTAEHNKW